MGPIGPTEDRPAPAWSRLLPSFEFETRQHGSVLSIGALLSFGRFGTNFGPLIFKLHLSSAIVLHLHIFSPPFFLLFNILCTTMAGKSIVPFVGSMSTFALEGEPLPANKSLTTPCTEEEMEAIMEMPLAVLSAPQQKETPNRPGGGRPAPRVD